MKKYVSLNGHNIEHLSESMMKKYVSLNQICINQS